MINQRANYLVSRLISQLTDQWTSREREKQSNATAVAK